MKKLLMICIIGSFYTLVNAQGEELNKEVKEKEKGGFLNTDLTISIGKCYLKPLKNDRA